MTRALGISSGTAACLLGAMLLGGGGCTEYDTGFYVLANLKRDPPGCLARAEANATQLGTGTLDVGLRLNYDASLLVANQLTPRGDKENLRTETATTTIQGAEVRLLTDTGELDTEFTVAAAGVVVPEPSEEPGFGIINVTLIPAATGLELAQQIQNRSQLVTRVANVKVFGETIGGVEVESAEMTYVIQVCEGCLVAFPSEALTGGVCDRQGEQTLTSPCRPGQDDPVDCRLCAANNAFCASVADP